jgi:hypothetical protein
VCFNGEMGIPEQRAESSQHGARRDARGPHIGRYDRLSHSHQCSRFRLGDFHTAVGKYYDGHHEVHRNFLRSSSQNDLLLALRPPKSKQPRARVYALQGSSVSLILASVEYCSQFQPLTIRQFRSVAIQDVKGGCPAFGSCLSLSLSITGR